MSLTQNEPRAYEQGDRQFYPVAASAKVYEGSAVGENSGYARALAAADIFLGFAMEQSDNTTGGAGDKTVEVITKGRISLAVAGATDVTANALVAVYATDDGTFTTTATSNSLIGYVAQYIGGNCVVEFNAATVRAALQA